jgi:hypothetical protein
MDALLQHSPDEHFEIYECFLAFVGRESADGIATHYGLDGLWNEFRWKRDLLPFQVKPWAQLGSHKVSTGSFPRGYSGRGSALTIHCHIALKLKKE